MKTETKKGNTTLGSVLAVMINLKFFPKSKLLLLSATYSTKTWMYPDITYPVYETVMPATLEFSQPMAKKKSDRK